MKASDKNSPGDLDTPLWRTMNAPDIQREYSPSSAVGGDYQSFIRDYLTKSETARAACRHIETLAYADRPSNTIDLALPEKADGCPLIVFIHGGYWQALSKLESFFGADWFCEQGVAYAAIDYTLAPHTSLTGIVEECRAALATLFSKAEKYGIDSDRIFVAGSSAGAHLSGMCCCGAGDGARPAGAILLSGIYELEPFVGISDNDAVGLSIAEARTNSPLLLDTNSFPDTIISWGEQETQEFKRQSRAFANKLQYPKRSTRFFESPARNHFDVVHDMYDPTTELNRAILDLIKHRR